jgi:hypothetical protein
MNDTHRILLNALIDECLQRRVFSFDFSVEMWGVMWMPWNIYIGDEPCRADIPLSHIDSADLDALVKQGMILKVKEFGAEELDQPLEISRTRYILLKRMHVHEDEAER